MAWRWSKGEDAGRLVVFLRNETETSKSRSAGSIRLVRGTAASSGCAEAVEDILTRRNCPRARDRASRRSSPKLFVLEIWTLERVKSGNGNHGSLKYGKEVRVNGKPGAVNGCHQMRGLPRMEDSRCAMC